ncbi:MAG: glycosyltransferase involved in cell wall biosynthesis [Polaribacter sp.]|jgi:glycosyltransferase involved in cell wall biosynthesis
MKTSALTLDGMSNAVATSLSICNWSNEIMLVSGLSVVKNGIRLGYPFLESIRSAISICDEFVVVVDPGEDDSLAVLRELQSNEPKLKIIETQWSRKVTPQKCVLAQQTNLGLHQCQGDWVLYLQANEVLRNDDLEHLKSLMVKHKDDQQVEAMLFERLTFWADYNHVLKVYPDRYIYTARIVRPHIGTQSIRDAMSFAVFDNWSTRGRYPRAIDTGVNVYRYGKVLSPAVMKRKQSEAVHESIRDSDKEFFYDEVPGQYVVEFRGEHPRVMQALVENTPNTYDSNAVGVRRTLTWRERTRLMETAIYRRFGVPHWRRTRHKLVGNYVDKDRDEY